MGSRPWERNIWRENANLADAFESRVRALTHQTIADLLDREEAQEEAYATRLARRMARFEDKRS